MAPTDSEILIETLLRTREALEQLLTGLSRMQKSREWTVTEEAQARKARRFVRKITNDYLPWARLESLRADRAAEIAFWLNGVWSSLPLED